MKIILLFMLLPLWVSTGTALPYVRAWETLKSEAGRAVLRRKFTAIKCPYYLLIGALKISKKLYDTGKGRPNQT